MEATLPWIKPAVKGASRVLPWIVNGTGAAGAIVIGGVIAITAESTASDDTLDAHPEAQPVPDEKCEPPNECDELLKKITAHMSLMEDKYQEMLVDQYDLYHLAYDINPGGDLAGYGTWVGHQERYEGLRIGLIRMVEEAEAKGCPVPPSAYELMSRPAPSSPM